MNFARCDVTLPRICRINFYIRGVKYILFVIFPLAVMFGSFLEVVETERATEGLRQDRLRKDVFDNKHEHNPSNIKYRKGRDGL